MASIQDVADQINARLDQITQHTADTAQNTADVRSELQQANNRLGQIDANLQAGFANLSQGLFALIQVQLSALQLLDHHRRQNDTIICELVNNNELLCEILRKTGRHLRLSEASLESVQRIDGVTGRVHCCEAGDYDRDLQLQRKLNECCPPEPVPEEECPKPCRIPRFQQREPVGQDWEPLSTPKRPTPVG